MSAEFSPFQIAAIGVIILLAAMIKTSFGVGGGIFMTSTLCLVMPPKLAVGLGGPIMLLTDILPLMHYRKDANKPVFLTILLSSVVGMVAAGMVMSYVPDRWFARIVGLICGIFAVQQLASEYLPRFRKNNIEGGKSYLARTWVGVVIGFFGGVAGILAHSGGVVYSIYMLSINLTKQAYVGTLIAIFFVSDILKNVIYWNVNALTPDMLKLVLWMIPLMVAGSFPGYLINKRIPPPVFTKLILAFVIVVSIRLVFFYQGAG